MPLRGKVKPCRYCGRTSHQSFQCGLRQKPIKTFTTLKKIGTVGEKWKKTRREWIKQNPAPWHCYLCGKYLASAQEMTIDHIKSRSRKPELRFELTNLAPACWKCNMDKGSKDITEL